MLHRVVKEHQIAGAVEDVPPAQRAELTGQDAGPDRRSLLERVLDEIADAGLDSYGDLETVPLLHFLSQYPVVPYTYVVSPELSRGERPSVAKLRDLAAQGYQRTVNLCAESPGGDTPLLIRAGLVRADLVRDGLPGSLHTVHIPIVDMHIPTEAQVVQLLDLVTAADAPRTYLHCEAGKCRTGVMAACYRMAVLGWSVDDAYAEAERFGCSVPQQKQFICSFGKRLQGPGRALGRYPLRPLGSVQPTPEQRAATLVEVARQEKGQPE
jgi:protein tyrosine phosphatase (PTP) superfamily phosphohydrolase (DUF442 family)